MMKTVKYLGQEYLVPDWTRFMATDEDGEVFAYENMPDLEDGDDKWFPDGDMVDGESGKWRHVTPKNWKDSLVELEQGTDHEND